MLLILNAIKQLTKFNRTKAKLKWVGGDTFFALAICEKKQTNFKQKNDCIINIFSADINNGTSKYIVRYPASRFYFDVF